MTSSTVGSSTGSKRRSKSVWRNLLLICWKNLLLRKRHWLLTTFEIVLPTVLFVLLLTIRILPDSAFVPKYISNTTEFGVASEIELHKNLCNKYGVWIPSLTGGTCCTPENLDNCTEIGDIIEQLNITIDFPGDRKIFYGPPGNFTYMIAKHVADDLGISSNEMDAVATNDDLDVLVSKSYYETNDSWAAFYVGLYFYGIDDPASSDPPENLQYDLRLTDYWFTSQLYPYMQIPGPRNFSLTNLTGSYNMDGFTYIQSLIDRFYISKKSGNAIYKDRYQIETQMYPYPSYYQDYGMSQFYGSALPTFVVLSLVLLSPSLIKSVVHEKETGVRELVRLMGLDAWLVWFGWFLHSFIIILIVSTVMTIMLKLQLTPLDDKSGYLPPILAHSDPFFIWVLLVLYGISSIAFCFAVATFFSKPTLATTMGILLWLTSYFVPRSIMEYMYDTLELSPKILSCLLPNMAITWAFRIIAMFEGRFVGVQWDRLWDTGNPRDDLAPAMILLMLLLDTFMYLLLTWYVDQVSPGTYGVPQPWYFPFQKTYWCGVKREVDAEEALPTEDLPDRDLFEDEPVDLRPGIVIKNLRKEFKTLGGKVKVAVENVSMACYEGQCTVLLGHNGAGKTTTMSVLTGVYAATSGSAEVGGWNLATNLKEAREEVGLCPQHNMLFVDLTVLQHLLFFGRLKGMTRKAAQEEAQTLMEKLELLEKKNMYGNQLSGGMKRKLCLAISLIGGSKVVILDEPSSGLDPESRRWVWNVVQGERGRRTVLVTTHHMEEADVLGDRVAIMASGRVVCAGSTLFLKNKFGDGYTLTLMMSEGGDVPTVKSTVTQHLPSAVLRSARGGEVTFKLPSTTSLFAPMLTDLTARKEQLGIRHLGLSLTSMEQVFLRVGEVMDEHYKAPNGSSENKTLNGTTHINGNGTLPGALNGHLGASMNGDLHNGDAFNSQRFLFNSQTEIDTRLTGCSLLLQRLKAFLVKRAIYSKRKWVLLFTQGLLPVVVTVLCLLVDASFSDETLQEPPREMDISIYPSFTSSFVNADTNNMELADWYQTLFSDPHKVNFTNDVMSSLLDEADEDLSHYRENSICSAEFFDESLPFLGSHTTLRMMYQSVPFHCPGVGMNLMTNALLRMATSSENNSITTYNRPLPPNRTWRLGNTNSSMSAWVYAMVMPLALAFLSASFLVFPLQERETKSKQVQVMTGAPVWALWVTTFIWDFAAYLVSAILVFILFMAADSKDYFIVDEAPGALFLLLTLYGWAAIPMAYAFSFPFQTAASGFAVLALFNIVAGQIITTAVWALDLSQQPSLIIVSDVLHWITSLIPTYPASMAFMHLVDTSVYNTQCDVFNQTIKEDLCTTLAEIGVNLPEPNAFLTCCPQCVEFPELTCFTKRSYFEFGEPGMASDFLTLTVNGIIFMAIIVLIEADVLRVFRWLWWEIKRSCLKPTIKPEDSVLDDDVTNEAALVETMIKNRIEHPGGQDDATLLVSSLYKNFYGAVRPAVNHISFRVGRGECLGLLGVNGAGKTTTFRMLTGDEKPSAGDAMIGGISLLHSTGKFVQEIGYCPQFDAVLGELTGVEMLTLLGRLRGVHDRRLKHLVTTLVSLVDLTECANRPSATYSGGNRRKLSTAMALIGSPPLVFLDEPTSGVDPASRRRVWSAVSQAVSNGQSVVLTSHSMEECEALCSRIIIMSRGTLRCVGTTGHLKAKFGQGYSLQVKLRTYDVGQHGFSSEEAYTAKVAELKRTISYHLSGAALTDEHKGMLAYRIPSRISWGKLFTVMEALKNGRNPADAFVDNTKNTGAAALSSIVEDYAASDTSLEQVFLSFAREASPEKSSDKIPTEVITKL